MRTSSLRAAAGTELTRWVTRPTMKTISRREAMTASKGDVVGAAEDEVVAHSHYLPVW